MLEFDNSHKSIEGNLNNKKGKNHSNITILGVLLVTGLLLFSGCARNIPCEIDYLHAHYYANQGEFGRYIVSEKSSISGLDRTDKIRPIYREDEKALLDFANANGLFKISENKEAIERICKTQFDHREYKYTQYYPLVKTNISPNGKASVDTVQVIHNGWTPDPNMATSRETRDCHYVYFGYKVDRDENGNYRKTKSDPVDSISSLPPGYDYVDSTFYSKVNANDYSEIFYDDDGIRPNYAMPVNSLPLN